MTPESRMAAYKSAYEAANGTGGLPGSGISYEDGWYWLPPLTGEYPQSYRAGEIDSFIKTLRRAAKARTK